MITAIAWRNVWRNKARSLIIMASVSIGLFGGVFSYAFMQGAGEERIRSAIEYETTAFQIHNPKFLLNNEIEYRLQNPQEIAAKIKSLEHIRGVSLRTSAPAMASTTVTGTGVVLKGVVPADEKLASGLYEKTIKGKFLDTSDKIPAFIGHKLAEKLGVTPGNKIVVTITNMDHELSYAAFIVCGIYKTSNDMFDGTHVFVLRDKLNSIIGYQSTDVNEIAVGANDLQLINEVDRAANKAFAGEIKNKIIDLQSWGQIQPTLKIMSQTMEMFSFIFVAIILLALAFGIVNTMLMAVMERTREIGMLMSVGMNKGKVFRMIMLETFFLAISGGIFGLLASAAVIHWTAINGINLSSVSEGLNALGYSSRIFPEASLYFYLVTAIMVVIMALISAIYPASRALKLNPATAVRGDS